MPVGRTPVGAFLARQLGVGDDVTEIEERPGDEYTEALNKPGPRADGEHPLRLPTSAHAQAVLDQLSGSDVVADKPNRAIPPWAINSLVDGLPKYTSARKIWGMMLRIAMSAQSRGWTRIEFVNEVTRTERRKNRIRQKRVSQHKLWLQLVACSRDEAHAFKQLDKAWAQGIENRANIGFRTAEDLIADAVENAYAWSDRLTEGKDGLSDREALVMYYVIDSIEKRQMSRVTCPSRDVGEFTGIPHMTAARILKRLTEKGFLLRFSRGHRSKDPGKRRAAIYTLGDPFSLGYGGYGVQSDRLTVWKQSVWKQYVAERDSEDVKRLQDRGICVWGEGMVPTKLVHRSTSPECPMYHGDRACMAECVQVKAVS